MFSFSLILKNEKGLHRAENIQSDFKNILKNSSWQVKFSA
jgi:hypothetical protein